MESSSFYITCPSNASMLYYPNNTQASFKINLPKRLYLQHKYEVGLAEIQYPITWKTFADKESAKCEFNIAGDIVGTFFMPAIKYDTIHELIAIFNSLIAEKFKYINLPESGIKFKFFNRTNRVYVEGRSPQFRIKPSRDLALAFGFDESKWLYDGDKADYPPDVQVGLHSLYIYCNIVDSQIVGDVFAPLLSTIGIKGRVGQVITKTFGTPQYVPVGTDEINCIEMNIKDDTGRDISFETGKVIIKLHFRQKAL